MLGAGMLACAKKRRKTPPKKKKLVENARGEGLSPVFVDANVCLASLYFSFLLFFLLSLNSFSLLSFFFFSWNYLLHM